MYWVVLSLLTTAESTLWFLLAWVPFYSWLRLFLHLYLVLPGKQGATHIYQEFVHPFLAQHEADIDVFISDAHEKAKAAGLLYFKHAVEWVKVNVLGLPPQPPPPPQPQGSYAQQLLSRFNLPSAREGLAAPAGDFVGLLASALQYSTGTGASRDAQARDLSESGTLIPPDVTSPAERMTYVATQRERLRVLLSAFDREAYNLASSEPETRSAGAEGLSKSRSEADFDKIEKEEVLAGNKGQQGQGQGGWMPWNWSRTASAAGPEELVGKRDAGAETDEHPQGRSSGIDTGR